MTRRELLARGAYGFSALALGSVARIPPYYHVAILNGRVIDPETGLDAIRHIGILGNRIDNISTRELKGIKTIDAKGMVVAPGFIDPISHGQNLENDRVQLLDGVTTKLQMEVGVPDLDAWHKEHLGKRMIHYGAGTSHTLARGVVLGGEKASEEKVADDVQIAKMAEFVEHGLKRGGLGVGFGLEYQPASTRWEVLEMFRVAGKYHASCHVHTRYGTLSEAQSNFTAIDEVFTAAMVAGAPLHIVHVPSMALRNTARVLKVIEAAQARGFDVTCDCYPYTAFGTGLDSEVFAPGWQERFGITYGDLEWGMTHERMTPESFERFRKEGGFVVAHAIPETAVRSALASPATMIGTDGGLENGVGHPRSAGTYARILGHYCRDEHVLSLPTAIRKMSLMPAKRFEKRCADFKRKGRIQVGADADIVVFDPRTVIDKATFDSPATPSVGFSYVLLNGQFAVNEGKLVEDSRLGCPLRAPIAG